MFTDSRHSCTRTQEPAVAISKLFRIFSFILKILEGIFSKMKLPFKFGSF